MPNFYLRNTVLLASIMLLLLPSAPARAAQEIVLTADQSQIVKLPEAPVTLLIGNPAIADATTEGKLLFLHPKGYGLTNIQALDGDGKKLGDYLVRIIYDDSYSVSMYSPGGRETYSCRKDCEPVLRIGDSLGHFSAYAGQVGTKGSLASTGYGDLGQSSSFSITMVRQQP